MTIAVDWDVKHQTKQTKADIWVLFYMFYATVYQFLSDQDMSEILLTGLLTSMHSHLFLLTSYCLGSAVVNLIFPLNLVLLNQLTCLWLF